MSVNVGCSITLNRLQLPAENDDRLIHLSKTTVNQKLFSFPRTVFNLDKNSEYGGEYPILRLLKSPIKCIDMHEIP